MMNADKKSTSNRHSRFVLMSDMIGCFALFMILIAALFFTP